MKCLGVLVLILWPVVLWILASHLISLSPSFLICTWRTIYPLLSLQKHFARPIESNKALCKVLNSLVIFKDLNEQMPEGKDRTSFVTNKKRNTEWCPVYCITTASLVTLPSIHSPLSGEELEVTDNARSQLYASQIDSQFSRGTTSPLNRAPSLTSSLHKHPQAPPGAPGHTDQALIVPWFYLRDLHNSPRILPPKQYYPKS